MERRSLGAAGWVLLLLGVGAGANGLIMLFDSVAWFGLIATDTGALNVHLVRDVGEAYATVGVALVWAALRPAVRGPLAAVAAVFLVLHSLGHVYETSVGELPPDAWLADVPGVHLPAAVVAALALAALKRSRAEVA